MTFNGTTNSRKINLPITVMSSVLPSITSVEFIVLTLKGRESFPNDAM